MVEWLKLLYKHEVLSSNPIITIKKKGSIEEMTELEN
jgi:hypothetical protein